MFWIQEQGHDDDDRRGQRDTLTSLLARGQVRRGFVWHGACG
jgi:hypothetical protein